MHRYPAGIHPSQRRRDGEHEHGADDHGRAPAHEDQQRDHHDDERRRDIDHEIADRVRHHLALVVEFVDLDADRAVALARAQLGFDRLADLDHICAGRIRDAHAHRRPAIVAQDLHRRIDIAARHAGQIAQSHDRAFLAGHHRQIAQFLDRIDLAGGNDLQTLVADAHAARCDDGILLC